MNSMRQETDGERFTRHMAYFGQNPKWNRATQEAADTIRSVINKQPALTVTSAQKQSLKARSIENQAAFRIVEEELPAPPEDDLKRVLIEAVRKLGDVPFEDPKLATVQVEWIGKRRNVSDSQSLPSIRQELELLERDCTRDLTLVYVHGGAFFQGDPKSYRSCSAKLVSRSGGRLVSIRYRLAPQYTFPAPLLDVLLVYLSLLSPSAGSHHAAVDASRIVLVGDSSGGMLIHGLLQILKQMNLSKQSFQFHSHTVELPIPYPAGSAVMGPVGDQLQAMPSHRSNSINDFFPPEVPWSFPYYPRCKLWPTNPPRPHVFCEMEAMKNPLNVPSMLQDWQGMPPMWFGISEDQFYDGGKAVARRAAASGAHVTWVEFEALPHCFAIMPSFSKTRQAALMMHKWASFCVDCVEGKVKAQPTQVVATRIDHSNAREEEMAFLKANDPSFEEIEHLLEQKRQDDDRLFKEAWQLQRCPKL